MINANMGSMYKQNQVKPDKISNQITKCNKKRKMAGMMTWDLKKNKPLQTHAEDVKKRIQKSCKKKEEEKEKNPPTKTSCFFIYP